jgi:hypothetical protein
MIHSLAILLKGAVLVSDSPDEIVEEEPVSLKESDTEIIAGLTNCLVPKKGIISPGLQILGALAQLMIDYADIKGGGDRKVETDANDNLNSVCYSFLVNIYLSNLYFNLSQIDSEDNFDYTYYKTLVKYIRIYFTKFTDSIDRVRILYKTLTIHPSIPDTVRFLAEQICIDSIGYESDTITNMVGVEMKDDEMENVEMMDIDTEINIDNMSFSESKENMLKYLQKEFEVIAIIDNSEKILQLSKTLKRKKMLNNNSLNMVARSPTRKKHRGPIQTPPRSTSPVH